MVRFNMHLLKGCELYMADGEYKISLGVDVDVSGIQEQINTETKKIEPIKINIDLNHTKKQVDAVKSQIKTSAFPPFCSIRDFTSSALSRVPAQ